LEGELLHDLDFEELFRQSSQLILVQFQYFDADHRFDMRRDLIDSIGPQIEQLNIWQIPAEVSIDDLYLVAGQIQLDDAIEPVGAEHLFAENAAEVDDSIIHHFLIPLCISR